MGRRLGRQLHRAYALTRFASRAGGPLPSIRTGRKFTLSLVLGHSRRLCQNKGERMTTTPSATKRFGLARRVAAASALGCAITAAAVALPSAQASATPWDPHVVLNGSISCPAYGGPFDRIGWAWVSASNGESGWAQLGPAGYSRSYRTDFWSIPYGRSVSVTVTYGCSASGTHSTTFGLSRPTVGIYATRNIY